MGITFEHVQWYLDAMGIMNERNPDYNDVVHRVENKMFEYTYKQAMKKLKDLAAEKEIKDKEKEEKENEEKEEKKENDEEKKEKR